MYRRSYNNKSMSLEINGSMCKSLHVIYIDNTHSVLECKVLEGLKFVPKYKAS